MPYTVTYKGECKSITLYGIKFVKTSNVKVLSDENAEKFLGNSDFNVVKIKNPKRIQKAQEIIKKAEKYENPIIKNKRKKSINIEDPEEGES